MYAKIIIYKKPTDSPTRLSASASTSNMPKENYVYEKRSIKQTYEYEERAEKETYISEMRPGKETY